MLQLDEVAVGAAEQPGARAFPHPELSTEVVIVPGWRDSGPDHWQTHWERRLRATRVQQRDWQSPRRDDWVEGLERTLLGRAMPIILVAHSLGCLAIAHWAHAAGGAQPRAPIAGALLVAPADVERPGAARALSDFAPVPRTRLPFPTLVVASRTDPYCRFARAAEFARHWGAGLLSAGDAGHINAESGHRQWAEGLRLLRPFGPLQDSVAA